MNPRRRLTRAKHARQRGVFAVLYSILLPLILIFLAMGLGLAQLYNRKVELQGLADAAALAAARQLNGTPGGLGAAASAAADTAALYTYNYSDTVRWSDSALSFGETPQGPWSAANPGNAARLFYVRVDTAQLGPGTGLVAPIFAQFLNAVTTVRIDGRAVAGRTGIKVTPLALCALSGEPATARGQELVEYGFRRGVVYDLMQLNPNGTTPEHFVVDPSVPAGGPLPGYNTAAAAVSPFVCTGRMWMPHVIGSGLRVTRNFPLGSLYKQLNSRFEQYQDGLCNVNGAPPDLNIRAFTGSWMSPAQSQVHTARHVGDGKSWTIADPAALPAGAAPNQWGALWSYARAVRYSSWREGKPEPAHGYTAFTPNQMDVLYQPGVGTTGYPGAGGTPYLAQVTYPSNRKLAQEHRRVLHLPLLACPVSAGTNVSATAIAVGKFFMVVPATSTSIVAEFAGIASDQNIAGPVELFP